MNRVAADQLILEFECALCTRCREWLPFSAFGKNRNRPDGRHNVCKPCTRKPYHAKHPHAVSHELRRQQRAAVTRQRRQRYDKPVRCLGCGDSFTTDHGARYCSLRCRVRVKNRRQHSALRARAAGVRYETVDHIAIFERDGWICAICRDPIDPTLRHPDKRAPSIDHRVPLSRGGEHTFDNCQATHFECNRVKGTA